MSTELSASMKSRIRPCAFRIPVLTAHPFPLFFLFFNIEICPTLRDNFDTKATVLSEDPSSTTMISYAYFLNERYWSIRMRVLAIRSSSLYAGMTMDRKGVIRDFIWILILAPNLTYL